MKNVLLLFSLFLASQSYAQQSNDSIVAVTMEKYHLQYQDCDVIKAKAENMASNGEFIQVSYGLVQNPFAVNQAFHRHMLLTYNIKFETKGCAVLPSEICYATAMNNEVKKKFGNDFVEKEFNTFKSNLSKE